jgi:hypothetical protein
MWHLYTVAGLGHTTNTVGVRYWTLHWDYSRSTNVTSHRTLTSSVVYVGLSSMFHCINASGSLADGDSMFVWNVCEHLTDYMASYYVKFNIQQWVFHNLCNSYCLQIYYMCKYCWRRFLCLCYDCTWSRPFLSFITQTLRFWLHYVVSGILVIASSFITLFV